jgi:hypothetical protein
MKYKSTKSESKSSMSLGIIDRRNNSVVSSEPIEDSQNPHILPPPDTVIWHYIRFDFFQALLRNGALWLTRLDKQTDKNDGMYSHANARGWTPVMQKLMERSGFKVENGQNDWAGFQWTNDILRRRAFIHCWSMRAKESAWMWNSFVSGEPRSVAVRSTVGCLTTALNDQPVEIVRMLYYPAGLPRPDWSYTAPFTAKDKASHIRERELRVITVLDDGASENTDHRLILVNLKKLIRKVVIHPASSPNFRLEVRNELKAYQIPAHVALSQLDIYDLEAVALHRTH